MKRISSLAVALTMLTTPAWPQATQITTQDAARQNRTATGSKGVVVSGNADATAAGVRILDQGGNAADAGAATLLALSVTRVGAFCVGGEVPILVFDANKKNVKLLAGMGEAPLDPKAVQWFIDNSKGIPSGDIKLAAVPAAVDAIITLLKTYGTKSFAEVVQPTLEILDRGGETWYIDTGDRKKRETGVHWQALQAVTFRKMVESEKQAKGTREQKLQAADDRFYKGDIADELERYYIEKGGFLRKADLAHHKTPIEDPLSINYRGYTVYKTGPWTQGPALLQALRLLEGFDLKSMGFYSADYIHTVLEAEKLAFADRDDWYGDPNFVKVPMQELLSDRYTKMRRALIDPKKASLERRPGDPINMKALKTPLPDKPMQGGTTVMCVTDKWGNLIAATPSGLSSNGEVAGSTGIIHGTRLSSLNTFKGHPNFIAPGKRPRITLSPTLILKDNQPMMAIAVAGGDQQDQGALQIILSYVDFGMSGADAFAAPRFSTTHFISSFGWNRGSAKLGSLSVSGAALNEAGQADLKARGHVLAVGAGGAGGAAVVAIDHKAKNATAAGPAAGKLD
jgi:gamma-glutamyltranspeptidase/glutathione hydrolase